MCGAATRPCPARSGSHCDDAEEAEEEDAGGAVYEELIQVQGAAARIVCARLSDRHLAMLQDSVQFAAGLPARARWDRRAAAHGQVLTVLAAAADDSVVAAILGSGAEHLRDLAIGAGPESAGMLASSHRRLLTHVRAGDTDAAAAEIEGLFRALHVMHRASRGAEHAQTVSGAATTPVIQNRASPSRHELN